MSTPIQIPEEEPVKSPAGRRMYKTLKSTRKTMIAYYNYLAEYSVELREMIFMAGMLKRYAAEFAGMAEAFNEAMEREPEPKKWPYEGNNNG